MMPGNFVLENEKSEKLWETFKNPTDTMLPGQIMEIGGKLFSRQSETNYVRGRFQLTLQQDENPVFSAKEPFYSTATTTGTIPEEERPARDYYLLSPVNSQLRWGHSLPLINFRLLQVSVNLYSGILK
ncbi:putative non-specific serine/threonine protein kinase [Rosa chinensis]|uniref:Putative non-specific serine/threonine protein kinase n=1 Tax=Rosa chinensis TaxID=74649 RepID=A0A2P6QMC6_ROSCH|nr:putative non-specific serine/threonine protein kinase [Rosa chinensis]